MPWSTLELDPAAATERDVKRAYAKRLKTCRPDQDPEGFRELHEAYTTALGELQWRGSGAPVSVPIPADAVTAPEPPPAVVAAAAATARSTTTDAVAPPVAVSLPSSITAVDEALDALELALKEGREGVADLVRTCEQALYEHPESALRWGDLMHDLVDRHGSHPDLRLKPEAMLFELEHGGVGATLAIIGRLDRQGTPQGIASLANLLLENKRRIAGPGAGLAAARLAAAAAFWANRHAAPLADFAYQHLARGERDYHMHMIDQHRAMADHFRLVPDRYRAYWRQRVMNSPGKDAWDDEESREALQWLQTTLGRSAPHFETFLGLLPEEIVTRLNLKAPPPLRPTRPASPTPTGPRVPRRPEVPEWDRDPDREERVRHRAREIRQRQHREETRGSSRSFPTWGLGFFVVLIIKVIIAMATCSNRAERASTYPGSGPIMTEKEMLGLLDKTTNDASPPKELPHALPERTQPASQRDAS
jgi:hypothetical protein